MGDKFVMKINWFSLIVNCGVWSAVAATVRRDVACHQQLVTLNCSEFITLQTLW